MLILTATTSKTMDAAACKVALGKARETCFEVSGSSEAPLERPEVLFSIAVEGPKNDVHRKRASLQVTPVAPAAKPTKSARTKPAKRAQAAPAFNVGGDEAFPPLPMPVAVSVGQQQHVVVQRRNKLQQSKETKVPMAPTAGRRKTLCEKRLIETKTLGRLFGAKGSTLRKIEAQFPAVAVSVRRKTKRKGYSLLTLTAATSKTMDAAACQSALNKAMETCFEVSGSSEAPLERPEVLFSIAVEGLKNAVEGKRASLQVAPVAIPTKCAKPAVMVAATATVHDTKTFPTLAPVVVSAEQKHLIELADEVAQELIDRCRGTTSRAEAGA